MLSAGNMKEKLILWISSLDNFFQIWYNKRMLSINRIFVGFFLMVVLYTVGDINPLISGIAVGLLFGLTDYAKGSR